MPRRYTPDEKKHILQLLQANAGDVALTSAQTGVPGRTIYRWQNDMPKLPLPLSPFVTNSPQTTPAVGTPFWASDDDSSTKSLPMDATNGSPSGREGTTESEASSTGHDVANSGFDWQTLQALLNQLTQDALELAESLHEAIPDASLSQRATALSQLIDRIMKLAALLPRPQTEQIIRIQYVDTDGSIHETPYWAGADSNE
jgi:arsenate reductase-like glutaredoxin family protein